MADFSPNRCRATPSIALRNAIMNHPPRSDSAALALQSRTRATKRVRYQCEFCGGMGWDTLKTLRACTARDAVSTRRVYTSRSVCGGVL
eukprot:4122394-Prymnesium_polylepis.1